MSFPSASKSSPASSAQQKKVNYATGVFFLNTLLGLLGVLISGASMYFLFRFCVAVIVLDEKAKRVLLGDSLFELVESVRLPNVIDPILVIMALYLSFRVVQFVLSTANFESNARMVYGNLQTARRAIRGSRGA